MEIKFEGLSMSCVGKCENKNHSNLPIFLHVGDRILVRDLSSFEKEEYEGTIVWDKGCISLLIETEGKSYNKGSIPILAEFDFLEKL